MYLEVSAPSLSALMAPLPKIITGEADAVHWRGLEPPRHLEIFTFSIGDSQRGRLKRLRETVSAPAAQLPYAPNACMALVSMSDAADQELARLEDWWRQVAPDGRPSFGNRIQIRDWDKDQGRFFAGLCERLVESQAADARRIVQLQKELVALRAIHEEAQITFSQLSDYIAQVHLPEEQLLYAAEPSHIAIYPQGKDRFQVEQILPVPSLGLAALELHVHSAGAGETGRLHVTLQALEDGQQLGAWSLKSGGLKPGWVRLDLSHAVTGSRRSVLLSVRWEGGPKSAPSLSLTDQRLVKECWLKVNDNAVVQRTLALKVWSGLPGLRRTRSARQKADPAVAGAGLHLERRPVPVAVRRAAKLVSPVEKVVDYDLLTPINDHGVFQLHPVENHVAVAHIPGGCPADARQLFATVKTNHPDAQPIEYAMMVQAPGKPFEGFPNSGSDAKTGNFSGWTMVAPNTESGVTVFLDHPFPVDADVYVATRVPAGKSNAFAWAWWLDFAALVG